MWKINIRPEVIEIGKGIEEFIKDFFEWVTTSSSDCSYEDLVEQATTRDSKISRVASSTKLKEFLALLTICAEKKDIDSYYKSLTRSYEGMIDGVLPDALELTSSSRELVDKIFGYFYENLLCSTHFQREYIPKYVGAADLKITIREIYGMAYKICPYCDIQWIGNLAHNSIDHFFPKSKYPLLSIFISNLIVSCTGCNDRLKKANMLLPTFHPHFHQTADYFTFNFDESCSYISVDLNPEQLDTDKRVVNYFELFNLTNQYCSIAYKLRNERSDIRESVKRLFRAYNPSSEKNKVLKDILNDELNRRLIQVQYKKGEFELTKVKNDFYKYLQTTSFELEYEFLMENLNIEREPSIVNRFETILQ
ncbi:hypothetical protein [Paenibacillus sp. BC26]|uniref:hypothetical protein n=1 Tax=Paenibacillus sp. BC26 TaxID=1881032 RepID=UPI0008E31726|nr:hypothetical protein [Paenibacillus sp. BC26]SFT27363.1 hypothetical protein SAMN05428962_6122 [Paenibacillus sp. BC26]